MNLKEIYKLSQQRLRDAGVDNPAFDAACILEKHTGIKRHEIMLNDSFPQNCDIDAFWADISRRERREPLQYIIGMWSFYGLDFFVGEGVLIPRQDTEFLAETAIDSLSKRPSPKFLELCAGSGCVSTAILKNVENSSGVLVELSKNALYYLEKNLNFNGVSKYTQIINADMLLPKTVSAVAQCGKFDAIVCNPPYIKSGDIYGLEPEVAEFEPLLALDGGDDGLLFYRAACSYLNLLKPGGIAAFEVGIGEVGDVAVILEDFGLRDVFTVRDYSGIERVVAGFC